MGNCFSGEKQSDHDSSTVYRPNINKTKTSSNYDDSNSYFSTNYQRNSSIQDTNRQLNLSSFRRDQVTINGSQNSFNSIIQNNEISKRNALNLSKVSETKPKSQNYVNQISSSTSSSTQDTNRSSSIHRTSSNLGHDQITIKRPQNSLNLTKSYQISKQNPLKLSTVSESKPKSQNYIHQISSSTSSSIQDTNRSSSIDRTSSNLGRVQITIKRPQNTLNQTKDNQLSKQNPLKLSKTQEFNRIKPEHCVRQRNLRSQNSSKQQTKTYQGKSNHKKDQFCQKSNFNQENEKHLSPPILRLLKLVYNGDSFFCDNQRIAFHYYKNLKTKLRVLKPHEPEHSKICNYLKKTHGPTHKFKLTIENIYVSYRWGVFHDFKQNKKLGNLKLLWHGSELSNFPSILSNGLLTQPPSHVKITGKMFGKGIYFADVVTKAAQYCKADQSNPYGILILAQVALGEQDIKTKSEQITSLPYGKNSVKALGKYQPNENEFIRMFGMEIPIGTPILQPYLTTSLLYNEYIVYDVNQIFIEYLVLVKFDY